MNYFSKNLKHLRVLKGKTQEQLADDCGMSRSRISSYEEKRADPPIEALLSFSEYFKLPIDILLKNDLSLSNDNSFIDVGNQRVLFPIMVDADNENLIEVVPIKATAGYLSGYDDPEYIEQLEKIKLPFLPTGKHRAFPIQGDSMLPVKDGSFIVAKFIENIEDIKNGRTYIVVTNDDGMTYKRVNNQIKENGTLELVSDNEKYPPYQVSINDVVEVWEFTCSINTQEYTKEEMKISGVIQMFNSLGVELKSLESLVRYS